MVKKKPTKKLETKYFPQFKPDKAIPTPKEARKKRRGVVRRYYVQGSGKKQGYFVESYTKRKSLF